MSRTRRFVRLVRVFAGRLSIPMGSFIVSDGVRGVFADLFMPMSGVVVYFSVKEKKKKGDDDLNS